MVNISKKLLRTAGRTNAKFGLIGEGDRVLAGLSGGKDSLTLVHLLAHIQQHAPFRFTFHALTVHYGMPGEDYDLLERHCRTHAIPHTVYRTNIFEVSETAMRQNSSFCSYFSRMRRGALYTWALENGYNKVALGHHLDDAAESFFMNMLYNGSLRSMPPIYKAKRGVEVIRPLIEVRERQTEAFAKNNGFATIGDEACPAMRMQVKLPYARESTKTMLSELEAKMPDLFANLRAAFSHLQPGTFLDPAYLGLAEPNEES